MPSTSRNLTFVYYCSGHGYGHATRVSAFARHLLNLDPRPTVYIVSSAPKHVFSDSIALGALYRNAEIDPVIVQPLAYRVDRKKSVDVLGTFLKMKDAKVYEEYLWLTSMTADCVLSDAAFLGCLAANQAGIPSILITNFSFDSVYSYLSTPMTDAPTKPEHPAVDAMLSPPSVKAKEELEPDIPIPFNELSPLVDEIHSGYRCADLLLRLPGAIPLPSFAVHPGLPSPEWVDNEVRAFSTLVVDHLKQSPASHKLHPQIPFPDHFPPKPLARQARSAPLLVRSPNPSIYTQEGRSRLLESIGVPTHLHNPDTTRILIVSFGGQVFHKPHSRSHSPTPFKASSSSHMPVPPMLALSPNGSYNYSNNSSTPKQPAPAPPNTKRYAQAITDALRSVSLSRSPTLPTHHKTSSMPFTRPTHPRLNSLDSHLNGRPRALSQLRLEGAPPAAVPTSPRVQQGAFATASPTAFHAVMIPPSPRASDGFAQPEPRWDSGAGAGDADASRQETAVEIMEEADVRLLPDESWIAVVCGVPKDWGQEDGEELPEGFFVAPRDVYMPDLTAVADVLLGKLGYGTVSECVDACTPFVYVPRPLFIEEHGLRLYLESEGVGVELSRTRYEVGEWADAVEEAWVRGREAKARKRQVGETGQRKEEGREMARYVVDWVERWKAGVELAKSGYGVVEAEGRDRAACNGHGVDYAA